MKRCARAPEKKNLLLSRKSLSVNRPGFAKKLGGLRLTYGHVPMKISRNERHTPTPATEFPFIYSIIYLFICLFIYYSAKFSRNYQTIFFKYLRRCLSYAMNMTASNHNNRKRRGMTTMATASPPDTWINKKTNKTNILFSGW